VRAFVTGGTGFIGGRVARKLRERGEEVVALVRSPEKADELRELGCELIEGHLSDTEAIRSGAEGADSVFHIGAIYKVGVPSSEFEGMYDANVHGTERVLDAAVEAGAGRIVYVSTINVFGNTRGEVVGENYSRDESEGFLSCYDETKYRAHQVAIDRIEKGAPIVLVQPGGVYGPGDHSEIGNMIDQTAKGKLRMKAFPETGFNMVHVDDVADGVLLALDKGKVGESYILGGEITTMRGLMDTLAQVADRKPPKRTMPTGLLKAMTPIGPVVGKIMGQPPNLRELISTADNVTFWAKHDKAMAELGYSPRGLEQGLRDTLAAEGKLPATAPA
jgi:nucleoside-diphosphate-sugar epimerase